MDDILQDDRFKHIVKDHRFKNMPRNERKFKVDKRFKVNPSFIFINFSIQFSHFLSKFFRSKNMFHDKKFKLKYSVDKRGRPVNLTTNENLKKYYEISSSETDSEDNEEDEVEKKKVQQKKAPKKDEPKVEDEESEDESESEEEESEEEEESDDDSESESESGSESEDDDLSSLGEGKYLRLIWKNKQKK